MPIKLNDIVNSATSVAKAYNPKFFSKELTGTGKKTGLINENLNPILSLGKDNMYSPNKIGRKTRKNGNVTIRQFNMNTYVLAYPGVEFRKPDANNSVVIATAPAQPSRNGSLPEMRIVCSVEPDCITIEEKQLGAGAGGVAKKVEVTYFCKCYYEKVGDPDPHYKINENLYVTTTNNPAETSFVDSLFQHITSLLSRSIRYNWKTDKQAYNDYMCKYNLYNEICRLSEHWQTSLDEDIGYAVEAAKNDAVLRLCLRDTVFPAMEDYNIPLDVYRRIYGHIKQALSPDEATDLCKTNMNLLLSDTLENLSKNKSKIQTFTPVTDPKKLPASFRKLSQEQQKAVSTTEPLVLLQAGAGCGKSHTILQRMDFMIASGVKRDDITVLSFTNAAADNITNRNPGVHSMTIARMIHNIYETNFPTHELSSIGTLINCIEIFYPDNVRTPVVNEFRNRLYDMLRDEKSGYTKMNNFVEKNYDAVIDILNTVKQTTLALEIIICYQKIETLQEPPTVRSKYLILDEVQDNSVFEFIYTLKYVDKHNESLFIVGDCSQTLYAFRAANPMAMNILENSGVFATYPLQINFRSNQEILDFANVMLRDIEANQFANIQLQANSLASVTEKSFRDKVKLHYECLMKIGDWNEAMEACFAKNVQSYIDAKLAAGEQIAFLAFTRYNTYKIQDILKKMYPGKKIVTLVPEKQFDSTLFSSFIRKYWDDIKFAPTKNIMFTIGHEIANRLAYLVPNKDKSMPIMQKMLNDWRVQCAGDITVWYKQYVNKQMTKDTFLDNVKESMLRFEINMNAVRQALLSARNASQKTSDEIKDANFILSTIHSAKGLEFDNTVVIYRDESMMSEEDKRMYYVALTRAMKSEFVLAYGTLKNPQIEADYKTVTDTLRAKAVAAGKAAP